MEDFTPQDMKMADECATYVKKMTHPEICSDLKSRGVARSFYLNAS